MYKIMEDYCYVRQTMIYKILDKTTGKYFLDPRHLPTRFYEWYATDKKEAEYQLKLLNR